VPADVDGASVLLEQHVAELAVLQLLPAARDVYMQEARRLSSDVNEGISATRENSDKLKALDTLAAELRARLAERTALVAGLLRANTEPPTEPRTIPTLFGVASGTRGL
jgi:hypothetical protein